MGIVVESLYVEHFKTHINNVYIALAQRDITIRTSKISPYKGSWINYSYGVWASEEMRHSNPSPITTVECKVEYNSEVELHEHIYAHIKASLTSNYENV